MKNGGEGESGRGEKRASGRGAEGSVKGIPGSLNKMVGRKIESRGTGCAGEGDGEGGKEEWGRIGN